jgi:alkanesulfonate monooxygenase SsuD/methylene tetrahydromethanopterin reductase-like flavin-dependent oxidoreductase (luciferase family)
MSTPLKSLATSRKAALEQWGIRGLALGISIGGAANTGEWQRALEWVERAEGGQLHSVWMPEMHFLPGASTSPLLCLSALAARTRRIRLATTSLLLPIHPPLRIAEEATSLDHLSGGRLILGLGRGFRAPLFSAFGIDPATKRDRFDAALDLMLQAWRGESVSLRDSLFHVDEHPEEVTLPRPLQRPHPPLAVAAFGPKGLEQAGRRRLPYLASPIETFEQIRENLGLHRRACPEGDERVHPVIPIMRSVFVSDDNSAITRVVEGLGGEVRSAVSGRLPTAIARAVAAPPEQRIIVGGVSEVTDRLAEYREILGMNLLVVRPQLAGASDSERVESFDLLVNEILPALRP